MIYTIFILRYVMARAVCKIRLEYQVSKDRYRRLPDVDVLQLFARYSYQGA
jgi:hypothetical protein